MEIKDIDYRRFELMNETLNNYYQFMSVTVDTADFVPPKKVKRINNMIFKEYKYLVKQAKKNYKVVYRYERKQVRKAQLKALWQKLKSKFKTLKEKIKNKFKKKSKAG